MNEWNLDALYTSFQDKNFQEDLNTLKDLNKNYCAYSCLLYTSDAADEL